jgi:hypothetical protein
MRGDGGAGGGATGLRLGSMCGRGQGEGEACAGRGRGGAGGGMCGRGKGGRHVWEGGGGSKPLPRASHDASKSGVGPRGGDDPGARDACHKRPSDTPDALRAACCDELLGALCLAVPAGSSVRDMHGPHGELHAARSQRTARPLGSMTALPWRCERSTLAGAAAAGRPERAHRPRGALQLPTSCANEDRKLKRRCRTKPA